MKALISALIIILSISAETKSEPTCKHVFSKDYLVFFYREEASMLKLHKEINFGLGNTVSGYVMTSICGDIDISEDCGQAGKAKLVFQSGPGSCPVIVPSIESWKYDIGSFETREQMVAMKPEHEIRDNYSVSYTFVCVPNSLVETTNVNYFADTKVFEVQIHGSKSCGYSVSFLKALSENSFVTGCVFLVIGVVLSFFGLKFYKDMLMFFVPTMIAILCFYLYLSVVEKSIEQNNRWLAIFAVLFVLIVIIALVTMFTNVIYFILCKLNSLPCQLRPRNDHPQAFGA